MFEFDCGGRLIGHIVQDVHDRLVAEMFTTAKAAGADAITALYHSCYPQFCAYERAQAMEVVLLYGTGRRNAVAAAEGRSLQKAEARLQSR